MIILDTDHLSVLFDTRHRKRPLLQNKMQALTGEEFATTIVTVEEQCQGWLNLIHQVVDPERQVSGYNRLLAYLDFLNGWRILPFEARAAAECVRLRKAKIRIGSQDLKIASIAIVHGALLLSANLRDFRKVPHLRVECWID